MQARNPSTTNKQTLVHMCSILSASLLLLSSQLKQKTDEAVGFSSTHAQATQHSLLSAGANGGSGTQRRASSVPAAAKGLKLTCVLLKAPSNRASSLREGLPPQRRRSHGKQAPHLEPFQSFHTEEHLGQWLASAFFFFFFFLLGSEKDKS